MKRVFDFLFSLLVLITLSPLFALIALGIRLSSPGKVFYSQERLGKGGRLFRCLKFRTMHVNADKKLYTILAKNPSLKFEWDTKQKLIADPRVFPFGKFLRRTSLDELPQFWNALWGDLSVVGPRPYTPDQQGELGSLSFKILSIRPGITGLWQTSGRSQTTFQERISLDAEYVDKKSFLLDLFLIAKTIPQVFSLKNAY